MDGIHIRGVYWIIEKNIVHDNGSAGPWIGIHIYTAEDDSEHVGQHNIIRYNTIYNQKGNTEDGAGIETDSYTLYNDIYYNVCYDNDGPGIDIYNSGYVNVYNNTCYGNMQNSYASHALPFSEYRFISNLTDNLNVKNNIGYSTKANTYAIFIDSEVYNNTISITNNDWFAVATNWYFWNTTGGSTLATWNAFRGVGTDKNSNPVFASTSDNNFHLLATSPCINAGVNVGLTADNAGAPIIGLPDIGAFEYKVNKRGK